MADPVIELTMTAEELAKMLPALKAYVSVPKNPKVPEELDGNGDLIEEPIDDLTYIKWLCVEYLARSFCKGKKKQATEDSTASIDTDLIKSIKDKNLI